MKTIEEIREIIRTQKPLLAKKHRVKEIGIFGSYVHDRHTSGSDLDVLIDFEEYPGLLEFIDIEDELNAHLGIKVDLVMKSGLKPKIGERILQEVVYV